MNTLKRFLSVAVLAVVLSGCGGRWIVEGCASSDVPNFNERQIKAKALESLASAFEESRYRVVLLNHDEDRPIGQLLGLRYAEGRLYATIEISRLCPTVWKYIRAGLLTGLSTNVYVIESEPTYFEELDAMGWCALSGHLIEISVCTLPADANGRIERWYVE